MSTAYDQIQCYAEASGASSTAIYGINDSHVSSLNQYSNRINKYIDKRRGSNMTSELPAAMPEENVDFSIIEQVVMQGDLSKLNPKQRVTYYNKVCESCGLNPFTRPFDYIFLNGKLTLYAKKDATEQLRKLNGISIERLESKLVDDLYIVTAVAKDRHGRIDQATGAVTLGHLKGDAKANAIMKAETKAKRRVTLSISGMGWTDETEIETIPDAKRCDIDLATGEIKGQSAAVLSFSQVEELNSILVQCEPGYQKWVNSYISNRYKIDDISGLPAHLYEEIKMAFIKNLESYKNKSASSIKSEEVNTQ